MRQCEIEGTPAGREILPPASELDRRAMGNDPDLRRSRRAHIQEEMPRRIGHHDHPLRLIAECGQHA